ncbi:MAG: carboxypeptidase regulatory-like domain-containing protein [Gemmatimonadaceae bacterium]|nr:carboxypeptidase regulatory-like domain-containing protein [Gemmatimonadaceae bacterium]
MHCRFLRPSCFAVLLALAVPVGLLSAQGRTGRIRGVVIDSLLGATLPGAEVRVSRLNRSTWTDSTGRFVFDTVPPGEYTIAFRHPSLDSLKIIDPGTPVRVFAGASAPVTLATPAFEAIRDRFCAETPDSLSPTVAFGSVHASDGSRVRINVSVSWMLDGASGENARPGSVRTSMEDESQVWVACGIPRFAWFHATVRDSVRSASAFLQMGPRDIAVGDLVLSSGVGPVAGTVRDAAGRPVRRARISVVGTGMAAESDASGEFVLRDVPGSTVTLDVRAAGHRPWVGALRGGGRTEVQLGPLPEPEIRPPSGSDYLRLLERSSREGIRLITGPDLVADSTALTTYTPAGACRWWLDGRPVERDFFLAQPRWSWRALEVYARGTDAPAEYRAPDCAVALLWTAAADW